MIRWRLRRGADEQTIEVTGQLRSNAPVALRALALDGAGIAYLPDWLVAEDVAQGRLRRVLPDWSSPAITAWALYRAELRGAPRLRAFLEVLTGDPPAAPAEQTSDSDRGPRPARRRG